ncbi:hypothetical protein BDF14DRAFT_1885784 [Spinellus fusiger]|nr:hypothetical protein BDF14DRAFT_1885784 [Spinellus fusiger]
MKFTLIATATLALAGMASAVHPTIKCEKFYTAVAKDSCLSVAKANGFSIQQFTEWNRGLVGNRCHSLVPKKSYCISANTPVDRHVIAAKPTKPTKKPSKPVKKPTKPVKKPTKPSVKPTTKPTTKPAPSTGGASTAGLHLAPHTAPNCKKYYVVKPGDGCSIIAQKNKISEAQLYQYNTGLHHNAEHMCDNLDDGRAYCVAV